MFGALLVAFAHVVLTGHRRAAIVSLVAGFVLFPWLGWALGQDSAPTLAGTVGLAAWLVTLVSVAEVVRARRDRQREEARSRVEAARRQAIDERLRIARELHDAVAHNMSLITIQAGVALHLMDDQPEQVRGALTTIRQASKDALVELRSILGVLRQMDEDEPRAPTPSLDRIDELVSTAAASGVVVHLEVEGDLDDLPRPVDLAAYRIIQESLTNVARHAGQPDAVVRIRHRDDQLDIEVVDEGTLRRPRPRADDQRARCRGQRHHRDAGAGGVGGRPPRGRAPAGPRVRRPRPAADRRRRMIRVVLADDQALVRAGLRSLLDAEDGIEVVGEAGDGVEAARLAAARPARRGAHGRAHARTWTGWRPPAPSPPTPPGRRAGRSSSPPSTSTSTCSRRCASGASGFLVKDTEPTELIRAVRTVADGDSLLSPRATRRLVEEYASRSQGGGAVAGARPPHRPRARGDGAGGGGAGERRDRRRGWSSARPRPRPTSAGP